MNPEAGPIMRIAHDSDIEAPTDVSIPSQRKQADELRYEAHLVAIEALDTIRPKVVRVANGARVAELHLAIRDAVHALEAGQPELALHVLRQTQLDQMPTRARSGGRKGAELGTP